MKLTITRRACQLLLCLVVFVPEGLAQRKAIQPDVGYLFPAGGCRGSQLQIFAGGQKLRGAKDVIVTGDGVTAQVSKVYKPFNNLQGEQRKELKRQVENRKTILMGRSVANSDKKPIEDEGKTVVLPDHPLFATIDAMSLRQLAHLDHYLKTYRKKRQLNAQLRDLVAIDVTIAADAMPGRRELRIRTPAGLTNPMVFEVGTLPEVVESEPNDPGAFPDLPVTAEPLTLPVTVNGQILPGDLDRIIFQAVKRQGLVIEVKARALIPYLADAVPGWFQPVVTLFDSAGKKLAFADDFRFQPDPVFFYHIPAEGEYQLEIRDAIYRGREDFVYRLSISEAPFVTHIFPLGGRMGEETITSVSGWNLPDHSAPLDTTLSDGEIRYAAWSYGRNGAKTNAIPYAVNLLPECREAEPNSERTSAQEIGIPCIINGTIAKQRDVDIFKFHGKAEQQVVIEVNARRLQSPVDSIIRLLDVDGNVVAWNDDHMEKDGHLHRGAGLVTHHADSYLLTTLPKDGLYFVSIEDSTQRGGDAYGYRLRLSKPQPDYRLRVTPATLNTNPRRSEEVTIFAQRIDGYAGPITVLLESAVEGLTMADCEIPAGQDKVTATLKMPTERPQGTMTVKFTGHAVIAGEETSRPVIPAENQMQAFLWRHLVPCEEFRIAFRQKGKKRSTGKKSAKNPKAVNKPSSKKKS